MGKYKFLYFILIAALLSCYKIPSKAPEWEIQINIPIGDSLITTYDIVDDTTIKHKLTIEQDPDYNADLWAVFHHSDTATGRYAGVGGDTTVTMVVEQKISSNIDTLNSHFNSLTKKTITKVYVRGTCDSTFYGRATLYITPPDTLQHFIPFVDTFPVVIPQTSHLDTMMTFIIDSFPLGPYRNRITIHHDSGSINIDSAMGYAKMPVDFMARGDTIVTFLKPFDIADSLETNKDKYYLKKVAVHLVIVNRTPAGFTGNFRIGTKDSSIVWLSRPITVEGAPKDPMGFTTGDSTMTFIDDTLTSEYVSMSDEDSLYWKADLIIPALGNVFLKPEDWIRMHGHISIDFWIAPDSLGGEE
ncbi:hypothetical protein KAX75_05670 [candidate division WOR-3 bacterium]|nr:hypothetical protein [candidate division WOR-3 bacterium]